MDSCKRSCPRGADRRSECPGRWRNPSHRQTSAAGFEGALALRPIARRLLSHPNGSALAILGHVDHTWPPSFGAGWSMGRIWSRRCALREDRSRQVV